jgi:hypothetical protein
MSQLAHCSVCQLPPHCTKPPLCTTMHHCTSAASSPHCKPSTFSACNYAPTYSPASLAALASRAANAAVLSTSQPEAAWATPARPSHKASQTHIEKGQPACQPAQLSPHPPLPVLNSNHPVLVPVAAPPSASTSTVLCNSCCRHSTTCMHRQQAALSRSHAGAHEATQAS